MKRMTHGLDDPADALAATTSVGGCVRFTGLGVPLDERGANEDADEGADEDAEEGADEGADEGAEEGASKRVSMFAEQMTSAPPPFVEPLHWLIVTKPDACAPLAVHVNSTSVPPFADPLHCVMSAPLVVAGKGSHPVVIPPPDPTHWFTVASTTSAGSST